ncbi:MAG: hypothetical protein VX938_08360, partial [Myxococcota bacterium]|nr:hypothetical protein [Myxococcota bacterium]
GVGRVLRDTAIPVTVDVDHKVPVDIDHPLMCPVKMDATFTMEREVEVSVDIPVSLTIPVETVVETKVLGLGSVSIPIKSEIPIDLVYPFRNTVKMKMEDLPVTIEEEAEVIIPVMEVPLQCRLETQLDLMSNLRPLRQFISGGEREEDGEDGEDGEGA